MKKFFLTALAMSFCFLTGTVMAEDATVISPTEEYVLFDQDGIKAILTGETDDSSNCAKPLLLVENSSDKSVRVSYTGTMNGLSLSKSTLRNGSDIKPGSKANGYLWFQFDDYDLTSSDDIETMDLIFYC